VLKIEGPICTFSICGDVEFKVGFLLCVAWDIWMLLVNDFGVFLWADDRNIMEKMIFWKRSMKICTSL
jgi:hypothetical protein